MTFLQKVARYKAAKRGMPQGHSLGMSVAQSAYEAADLHNRASQGASNGQGFVPDWNPGSSLFRKRSR